MARVLFILPLVIFLGMAIYFAIGLTKDPRKLPSALIDQPLPKFKLPALNINKPGFSTKDLKGKVAIVNVFASWCVPCRAEHPLWMEVAESGKVPIFAINWKDRRHAAINWLKELGDPYSRIGFDIDNKVGIEWGVYGVPETYIVDREGRIRYKYVGPLSHETYKEDIEPLLRDLLK